MLGKGIETLVPERDQPQRLGDVGRFLASTDIVVRLYARNGVTLSRKNGTQFSARVHIAKCAGDCGTSLIALIHDQTAQRQMTEALHQSERRFRIAFERAGTGMALISPDGRWMKVNQVLCNMLSYSQVELLDTDPLALIADADRPSYLEGIERTLAGECETFTTEIRYQGKDGAPVWTLVTGALVRNGRSAPHYFVMQMQDLSDLKRREANLAFQANHDALTGLFNRWRFLEELNAYLANDVESDPGALLFLDFNGFKHVNDWWGHATGDQVLQAVTRWLKSRLRDRDVMARLGGDEFVILLKGISPNQALAVADRLSQSMAVATFETEQGPIQIGASIGVALIPEGGSTASQLLALADENMYRSKGHGACTQPVRVSRRPIRPNLA